jgi:hypothetical protein
MGLKGTVRLHCWNALLGLHTKWLHCWSALLERTNGEMKEIRAMNCSVSQNGIAQNGGSQIMPATVPEMMLTGPMYCMNVG